MLRSGSICISFLYNYLLSENNTVDSEENNGNTLIKKSTKLKCLASTFASYGGVLAKLSQILCFEDGKGDVFSDCKPYAQKETIEYFKNEVITKPEFFKNVHSINFDVFKAGSIGQVHKCIYLDNKDIVIKVQYVGLYDQFKSDIFLLDKIASYLFYFSDVSNAMTDIKTKLYEELDYRIEFANQQKMFDLWKDHENIKITELIPELCTENLLSMHFIDADGLSTFTQNSTQEERNIIGMDIVDFIFTNFYKYGIFYSDIHYGNFLIKDKRVLYVTDFGCLNDLSGELIENLIKLHKVIIDEDEEMFYAVVKDMGILKDDIPLESKEYMYEYFKIQYEPWTKNGFEFTEEWLMKCVFKKTELMKDWILPNNCTYLNKIPYGMYHILTKLNLKGDFLDFFKPLLNYE